MSAAKKTALLLVGSPKSKPSTSLRLGEYLLDWLTEDGWSAAVIHINKALESEAATAKMLSLADSASMVILSFPLYVDSLPWGATRALELIVRHRAKKKIKTKPRFLAIVQNGFPEPSQNRIALDICRQFAKEAGFQWAGGLAMGEGGAIAGKTLAEMAVITRHARKALDMAAKALAKNKDMPQAAVKEMAKPMMPGWLYIRAGNAGWKRAAKKYGTEDSLMARPYEE